MGRSKVLLRGLKRRLEKAIGTWADEVPQIVWAYHTTPQSTTIHHKGNAFQPGVQVRCHDPCRDPGKFTAVPELRGRGV